jgi:hypothetical protein
MLLVRGCLIPLAIFGAVYFFEKRHFDAQQLPFGGVAAGILAFVLMIAIGGLFEMPNTYRKWAGPPADLGSWKDGEIVRVSGRLKPVGQALKAPFSQRPAVAYEYYGYAWEPSYRDESIPSARMRGIALGPCELGLGGASIRVEGIAPLKAFTQDRFAAPGVGAAVREHVKRTRWSVPSVFDTASWEANDIWTEDARARHAQDPAQGDWRYEERIIPPFADVTIVGTYRANPPRIDIQRGIMTAEHEIGPRASNAGSTVGFALTVLFQVLAMIAGAAGLWLVHAGGGSRYRALLQSVESVQSMLPK